MYLLDILSRSTGRLRITFHCWPIYTDKSKSNHIMYFSNSNQLLRCMSTSIQILFVDGTFKPE